MARLRHISTADTLSRVPDETAASPAPSPVATVEPEPAPAQPERSPARQRLAEALERVKELEAEIATAAVELSKADDAYFAAFGRLSDAEMQLKRAQPVEGAYSPFGGSAFGMPARSYWASQEEADRAAVIEAAPPMSIAEAKALVQTAQDEVDSAQRLRQHWRGRNDKAAQDLQWRRLNHDRVREVLRTEPALHALAAECKRLATASAAANQAFSAATGGDTIQPDSPFYRCTHPTDAREDQEGWALLYRWRVALAALASDPDAPLPFP